MLDIRASRPDAFPLNELFWPAVEVCVSQDQGSTSSLVGELRIGYGQAARIIDELHYVGILGPSHGSDVREVLVGRDEARAMMEEYNRTLDKNGSWT